MMGRNVVKTENEELWPWEELRGRLVGASTEGSVVKVEIQLLKVLSLTIPSDELRDPLPKEGTEVWVLRTDSGYVLRPARLSALGSGDSR